MKRFTIYNSVVDFLGCKLRKSVQNELSESNETDITQEAVGSSHARDIPLIEGPYMGQTQLI